MQANKDRGDRRPSAICVIADGREKVNRRLLDMLYATGLLRDALATTRGSVESHVSTHQVSDMLDLCNVMTPQQTRRTFDDPTELVSPC